MINRDIRNKQKFEVSESETRRLFDVADYIIVNDKKERDNYKNFFSLDSIGQYYCLLTSFENRSPRDAIKQIFPELTESQQVYRARKLQFTEAVILAESELLRNIPTSLKNQALKIGQKSLELLSEAVADMSYNKHLNDLDKQTERTNILFYAKEISNIVKTYGQSLTEDKNAVIRFADEETLENYFPKKQKEDVIIETKAIIKEE